MKNAKKHGVGKHTPDPDHTQGPQPHGADGPEETRQPGCSSGEADIAQIVESACQTMRLTEQQKCELRQCFRILITPESSPVCKGRALLSIIEHKLMPSWPDVVEKNWPLFKLSQSGVRKLVRLAREDRDQNGRNPSFAGGDDVPGSSSKKEFPASSAPSTNLRFGGPDVAQGEVPEETQAKVIAVGAVTAPCADDQSHGHTPHAIATAKPHATEPSVAAMAAGEEATPADTTPPVTKPPTDAGEKELGQREPITDRSQPPVPRSGERLPYLESIIGIGFMFVFEVGAALEEIRDHELFRPQFKTFAEYFDHKWGWTRARCYQLIGAAQVKRHLSTRVDISHLSEPLCRVLSKLPADDQVAAWNDAAAGAPDGKVTLVQLKKAVAKLRPPIPAEQMVSVEADPPTESNVEPQVVAPDHTRLAPPSGEPVTSSQLESAPDAAPAAPDGCPEFNLEIEWPPVEAALETLHRRCPPTLWPDVWNKLNAFFAKHPELIPAQDS